MPLRAVERALREAITAQKGGPIDLDYPTLAARALEAIREPDLSMVEAANRVHELEGDRIDLTAEIPGMWRAMIDAALRQGVPEPAGSNLNLSAPRSGDVRRSAD